MRPGVEGKLVPSSEISTSTEIELRDIRVVVCHEIVRDVRSVFFGKNRIDICGELCRIDPGGKGHAVREIERVRVRNRDPVVGSIEGQGLTELAGSLGGTAERAMVAVAGDVSRGRAAGFVEVVGGHQPVL